MHMIEFLRERYIDVAEHLRCNEPTRGLFIYVNPFNYFFFRKNADLIGSAYYRVDGFFVNFFVGVFCGGGRMARQSFDMTSLAPKVLEYCIANRRSVFFSGGNEYEVERFVSVVGNRYPSLKVAGCCSGYLSGNEIVRRVLDVRPDVVVLGLGNIKQESVGYEIYNKLECLVFTCGAFISQTARGKGINYYPWWVDKYNVRWAYRFVKEPHVIYRVAKYYPLFLLTLVFDLLKKPT